ncbi:Gfo/Idh/MocA family oxidoreductase [bacterium]
MKKLKLGVIGTGKLGQHHARIYSQMENVDLIGIVDIDEDHAKNIAEKYNTKYFIDYKELLDKVDAVNIAAPTPLHYEIGKFFLENKVHCFIEKPITVELHEAEELVDIAHKNNMLLQIGHIERFNSAVIAAHRFLHNPKFIEVNRLGPYDPRVSQVGVVLDLMIHDLDIVLYLTDSRVTQVDVVGSKVFSKYEDIANVRLEFENGCVANISASRISVSKFRKIRIFQNDSYMSLDYEKQKLKIYKKRKEVIESMKDIQLLKPRFEKNEPLLLELKDFVRCVERGENPIVNGQHGRNALELALEIVNKIKL